MRHFKAYLMVMGCVLLSGNFVKADVCDPTWWDQEPPFWFVDAEIQAGADVQSSCIDSFSDYSTL